MTNEERERYFKAIKRHYCKLAGQDLFIAGMQYGFDLGTRNEEWVKGECAESWLKEHEEIVKKDMEYQKHVNERGRDK
jgi:hypothetical protein